MKRNILLLIISVSSLLSYSQSSSYPVLGSTNKNDVSQIVGDSLDAIRDSAYETFAGYSISSYSSGIVYTMTASDAAITFGTNSPSITIDKTGTYLIFSGCNLKLNGTTYASNQTATCHVRRTNNTPADITSASDLVTLPIITTTTQHAGTVRIPSVVYTTLNTNDILQLYGSVSALPSAGTVEASSAFILVLKLY